MFAVLRLDLDTVALYESRRYGSEVLLFKRAQGFLSKLRVPERGEAVEKRLRRSFQQISAGIAIPKTRPSFVPQGFHGIHLGSAGCGNRSENNANTRRNQNGDNRRHS